MGVRFNFSSKRQTISLNPLYISYPPLGTAMWDIATDKFNKSRPEGTQMRSTEAFRTKMQ